MREAWSPHGAAECLEVPAVGRLVAIEHGVWRVRAVEDRPLTEQEQAEWEGVVDFDAWPGRPVTVQLAWVGGARPDWALASGEVQDAHVPVPASYRGHHFKWHVYPPSGRWPMCSCSCGGEPMPCRAELEEHEVGEAMTRVETLTARQHGFCWSCGEPISRKQRSVAYPGDNLDLPGGPEVRFHTRAACWHNAVTYELRWLVVDLRRERVLTYPACDGLLVVHGDGSSECQAMYDPDEAEWEKGQPDCRGHLTHDHRVRTSCLDGGPCPRGCQRADHRGSLPTPRPPRRTGQAAVPAPRGVSR